MTAVQEKQDSYFANFAALQKKLAGRDPAWLAEIRKAAIERFAELGFPTTKNEEWKYTSVAPIIRTAFEPAPTDALHGYNPSVPSANSAAAQLVFVNGRTFKDSLTGALPSGVTVTNLVAPLAGNGRSAMLAERHLARYAK